MHSLSAEDAFGGAIFEKLVSLNINITAARELVLCRRLWASHEIIQGIQGCFFSSELDCQSRALNRAWHFCIRTLSARLKTVSHLQLEGMFVFNTLHSLLYDNDIDFLRSCH